MHFSLVFKDGNVHHVNLGPEQVDFLGLVYAGVFLERRNQLVSELDWKKFIDIFEKFWVDIQRAAWSQSFRMLRFSIKMIHADSLFNLSSSGTNLIGNLRSVRTSSLNLWMLAWNPNVDCRPNYTDMISSEKE